jgi:hypothetical protein
MMYYLLLYDYYFRRYKRSNCDMFSLYPCSRCYPPPSTGKDVVLRQKCIKKLLGCNVGECWCGFSGKIGHSNIVTLSFT